MMNLSMEHVGVLQGGNASLLLLLLKATLILLGALLVTLSMQRAAAGARHVVWLVTLGALLLIPALTVWGPIQIKVLPPHAQASGLSQRAPAPRIAARADVLAGGGATSNTSAIVSRSRDVDRDRAPGGTAAAWLREADPLTLLLALWAAVALAIVASLAFATLSLRRVVRASTPLATQDWLNTLWEVSDRLELDHAPRLLQSRDLKMPFACGVLNPTVVLPIECNDWSAERRTAVLLHELAHVRRRDLLGHTLGRVACAVYWFHPLVWTAARRLRSESERACDDLALTCGTGAADYAEHLLDIVTSVRRDRTPLVALAMARRKEFEGRMLAILDPQLRRSLPRPWKTAALAGSLGALALVVAAATPAPRDGRTGGNRITAQSVQANAVAARHARAADTIPVVDGIASAGSETRTRPEPIAPAAAPLPEAAPRPLAYGSPSVVARPSPISVRVRELMAAAVPDDDATLQVTTPDERAALLIKVLKTDSSARLRRTAAWGLSHYVTVPVVSNALVGALEHDASASVRETAAWSLARGRYSDGAVARALGAAVRNDASDSVRATAAWALGNGDDASSTAALTNALSDRSAAVRRRAVWALGRSGMEHAPDALIAQLRDPDPAVRRITAWALFQIRDPATIPALQSALRAESDKDLQVDYVRALVSMGASSLDAIRSMLESPDPKIKTMAVNALAGGRAAGPWPWPWPDPRPFP